MKKIIFIIFGILLLCVGTAILFIDIYFNGPNYSFFSISAQIGKGINPTWALIMIFAVLAILGGLVIILKGLEYKEK